MCFYNEIVEPPSLWSRGYFPDFNVGLEWVRLYCHEDEAALISITFLTLGCQKQVWTGRLRILLEFGKVGKWDAYSNNCGGVVHFYSLPGTSGRLINLLSRRQELINCCSFSIPCRSPNPSSTDCRKWKAAPWAVWNGGLQHWQINTERPDVCGLCVNLKKWTHIPAVQWQWAQIKMIIGLLD